jgi:putative FmdB family regulatory protein
MPMYESECPKCGAEVSEMRTMAQGINKRCPECNGRSMQQVFNGKAPAVRQHGYMIGHPRCQRGRKVKEPFRR